MTEKTGENPDQTDTTSNLFWNLVYVVEALLGALLIAGIGEMAGSDSHVFYETAPHPYLFMVFFIALRYGLKGGITSAGLLTGIYLITGHFEGSMSEPLIHYSTMSVPLQLLITGAIAGEIREQQKKRYQYVSGVLEERKKELEALKEQYNQLDEVRNKLQKRISMDRTSFYFLNQLFQKLLHEDPSGCREETVHALADRLEAETVLLYRREGEEFVLSSAKGTDGETEEYLTVEEARKDPLVHRALDNEETASVRDLEGEEESEYLFCTPLRVNGETKGFVGVGDMPFLRFHYRSKHLVNLLTTWLSHFLHRRDHRREVDRRDEG